VSAFAPEITRQRLLVEGYFTTDVDEGRVEGYLHGAAAHVDLRTYGTAGDLRAGRGRTPGEPGLRCLPAADRFGDLAVRLDRTALRLGGALHLQGVDEREAISYTRDYFGLRTFESHAF
jgi:hypothetical protein